MKCNHDNVKLFQEPFKDNDGAVVPAYYRQCINCGAHSISMFSKVQVFDEALLTDLEWMDYEANLFGDQQV